jgi:hypothetical protein
MALMDSLITVLTAGLDEKAKVVIIGTSFIGMELAGAIVKKKPASIDVIGVDAVPFAKILGEKIGAAVQKVSLGIGGVAELA